jgi:hypothetical protein
VVVVVVVAAASVITPYRKRHGASSRYKAIRRFIPSFQTVYLHQACLTVIDDVRKECSYFGSSQGDKDIDPFILHL